MEENLRIIISGGGTGGHIFPAVSIANAIKEQHPEAEILFVGAEGRMEMQRVPAAGYPIKGLPVAGFDRKNLLKNVSVLFKLVKSQLLARKIIKDFKPHAAVGVGGYASGPTLKMAGMMGIPTLIQEQNSYAGVTNKLLAKKACKICVAYGELPMLHVTDFISDMAAAYSAADLIISRAGAGSISEFCLLQKPVILVPSPNVAEDHQTKNALALVNKNAALYIKDAAAKEALLDKAVETVKQPETLKSLSTNIAKLAFTDSANVIAREVFKLADKYRKENGR